jgi:flagellar biosynthetic protein FlhB
VAILAVIADGGLSVQYRQSYERQKMSVAELKEEFKQTDGDPAIKAKIRRIRMSGGARQPDRRKSPARAVHATVEIDPGDQAGALQGGGRDHHRLRDGLNRSFAARQ